MANFENIIYETRDAAEGQVAYITLNRPERLNALSRPLLAELEVALNDAAADDNVRCIVIKGAGRGFSAGYDMNVQTTGRGGGRPALDAVLEDGAANMYRRSIWGNPKPVIAQVHSFTLAGGGQLACHCDITIAADNALFGYPPVRYASMMMPMVWPELVGMKKAKLMAFTGSMITADDALRHGLVSDVVPTDDLDEHVWQLANTIAKLPPASTKAEQEGDQFLLRSPGSVRGDGVRVQPDLGDVLLLAGRVAARSAGREPRDGGAGDARRLPVHERSVHRGGQGRAGADGASEPGAVGAVY